MSAFVTRGLAASTLVAAALLSSATGALAAPAPAPAPAPGQDGVVVVDRPDTGDLNNKWTFAPLGVPVFGLIDSVLGVPEKLLPIPS